MGALEILFIIIIIIMVFKYGCTRAYSLGVTLAELSVIKCMVSKYGLTRADSLGVTLVIPATPSADGVANPWTATVGRVTRGQRGFSGTKKASHKHNCKDLGIAYNSHLACE